jgi:hypothetical protein
MPASNLKVQGHHSPKVYEILLVIVTNYWQKLSNTEHKVMLIITDFWQLFSQIFGRTLLRSVNT